MKVHHDQGAEAQRCEDYAKTVTTNPSPLPSTPSSTGFAQIMQSTQVSDICVSFVLFISAASGARLVTFSHTEWPTPESSEEGVYIFFSFSVWPNSKIALSSSNKFVLVETSFVFPFFFSFFPSSSFPPTRKVHDQPVGRSMSFSSFLFPHHLSSSFLFPLLLLHLADHDLVWLGPSSQGPCSLCRLGGGQLGCRLTSLGEQARRQAMTFDKHGKLAPPGSNRFSGNFAGDGVQNFQIPS
jgi:hypothetical protein